MRLAGDLSTVLISTGRLTLRSFTPGDARESFVEATPQIATYMSWNAIESEDEYRPVWQGMIANMMAGTDLGLVARLKSTGEFIGIVGLHGAEGDLLETGLWLKEPAQGHGYGREAVAAVVAWASEHYRPGGFLYPVVDENVASCRLAESLGGRVTGMRQRQKPRDSMRTLLLYVIPAAG